jgi:hypothetical protein
MSALMMIYYLNMLGALMSASVLASYTICGLMMSVVRLNQIPSQNMREAYNKVHVSSGQCRLLDK